MIEPCANSTSQASEHWLRPAAAITSGQPGRCIATSGTNAVLATCANVTAQHWQPLSNGTVRGPGCLAETVGTVGSAVSVGRCAGGSILQWKLVSAGPIATELVNVASGLCVSVPANGTRLVVAACANAPTTTWHVG